MPRIIITGGQIAAEFRRYFDLRRLKRAESNVVSKYERLVRDSVPNPAISVGGAIAADEMYEYLEGARKSVEDDLHQRVQHLSPFQWLWYLRHLPLSCWLGKVRTTAIYDSALAEILSGESATSAPPERTNLLRYPVDESTADLVAEFIAGARYLSQIHTNLRWVGKGAEFSLSTRAGGSVKASVDLKRAVELYDARVDATPGDFLSTTGSVVWTEVATGCSSEIIAVWRTPPVPWRGSWNATLAAETVRHASQLRFGIMLICLDELARLNKAVVNAGARWWLEELPLLVGFLRAMKGLAESDPMSMLKIVGLGWIVTDTDTINTAPDYVIEDAAAVATHVFPGTHFPTSYRELIDAVSAIKGKAWPTRCGPAIRAEGTLVCIDLYATTMMLHEFAEFNAQGGIQGNLRGRDFERAVQGVIDLSSWAPPQDLRLKVGQTIRIGGQGVTDFDAIGLKDRKLMLVSCKSRIYSGKFNQGDPRTVRATASVARDGLRRWSEVKLILEANPRCLPGFDFSEFEILPIVCLPHVPYVPIGPETQFIAPELRAVVSVSELRSWLNRQS